MSHESAEHFHCVRLESWFIFWNIFQSSHDSIPSLNFCYFFNGKSIWSWEGFIRFEFESNPLFLEWSGAWWAPPALGLGRSVRFIGCLKFCNIYKAILRIKIFVFYFSEACNFLTGQSFLWFGLALRWHQFFTILWIGCAVSKFCIQLFWGMQFSHSASFLLSGLALRRHSFYYAFLARVSGFKCAFAVFSKGREFFGLGNFLFSFVLGAAWVA